MRYLIILLFSFGTLCSAAQNATISGTVTDGASPLPAVNISVKNTEKGAATNADGFFKITGLKPGIYQLQVSSIGFKRQQRTVSLQDGQDLILEIELKEETSRMNEVVVTGTMKEVSRLESPVPVEVYSTDFLARNPAPSLFESLQNINGVRPQLNCNICNTGDIHINGLEGPYSMVTIDGMPIVSGLSTVYGLSGIPTSLIERVEIVKGPASSLYGSEAVGGLINVITKNPGQAPRLVIDLMSTTWLENNADIGFALPVGSKTHVLTGINYFNYSTPKDVNGDNFTDVTLQDRISIFQKWKLTHNDGRSLNLAGRFYTESRWGGEMQWTPEFRGTDSIYGESIETQRVELLGNYELPLWEKTALSFSLNDHRQDSYYGDVPYIADQQIGFVNLNTFKTVNKHDLLIGVALRYIRYDDNTTATQDSDLHNKPSVTWLPGLYLQDEISVTDRHKLLLGARYDYNSLHGNIFTPRLAYKYTFDKNTLVRLNAGTGYRVVNLFTEDHAATTGARDVIIAEELDPETSYNLNVNFIKKMYPGNRFFLGVDASVFYTHFTNQILPDYDSHPNQIIYENLDGYSFSRGATVNVDATFTNGLKIVSGITFNDVQTTRENEEGELELLRPVLTEKWMGTWAVSYSLQNTGWSFDYTGNIYGPMRLPLLGDLDPRPAYSPVWSLQNIKISYRSQSGKWEFYGGIKNLLDWTPADETDMLIARAHDPFDKEVDFDNPHALTFDPSYVYAPNQGIRGFVGIKFTLR